MQNNKFEQLVRYIKSQYKGIEETELTTLEKNILREALRLEEKDPARYFDVYFKADKKSGFSVFVAIHQSEMKKIDSDEVGSFQTDEILNYLLKNDLIDKEDFRIFHNVRETTQEDYLDATVD